MSDSVLSKTDLDNARYWLRKFSEDLLGEIPLRIHSRAAGGLGAAPPFSDEFVSYIGELACKNDDCREEICTKLKRKPRNEVQSDAYRIAHRSESRSRMTKALRKLRRVAPLEYDVLYLITMHGMNVHQIAERMTKNSYARGFDEDYNSESVTILAVSGVEKVSRWY